jgi:hypothetical protein
MVMMRVATGAIAMGSIRKGDAVKETVGEQHVHGAVDRRPTDVRIIRLDFAPEILRREISVTERQCSQTLGDEPTLARITKPHRIEDALNTRGSHRFCGPRSLV